jgi:hypothetical protein
MSLNIHYSSSQTIQLEERTSTVKTTIFVDMKLQLDYMLRDGRAVTVFSELAVSKAILGTLLLMYLKGMQIHTQHTDLRS